jgi:hypothetical protein
VSGRIERKPANIFPSTAGKKTLPDNTPHLVRGLWSPTNGDVRDCQAHCSSQGLITRSFLHGAGGILQAVGDVKRGLPPI